MKKNFKDPAGIPLLEDLPFTPTDIEFLEVTEAEKAKGVKKARITVIKAGLSKNLHYYSDKILEKLPPFIEAHPKMYLDHDIWGGMMGRSMKEWAATITKVWYDAATTSVKADIRMTSNPNTTWLYDEMEADPKDVGCSIDARVMAHEAEMTFGGEKVQALVVDSWVVLNSVDFVTYAAAGGGIERVAASENPIDLFRLFIKAVIKEKSPTNTEEEEPSMDLKELREKHPELVLALIREAETPLQAKLDEAKRAAEADKAAVVAAATAEKTELTAKITTLEGEKTAIQAKLDVFETKERQAAHQAAIDTKLAESVTKGTLKDTQISAKFKELLYGTPEMSKVEALIAEREEAFAASNPVITGVGPRSSNKSNASQKKITDDELVAGLKAAR